jgi:hypothetical protein
MKLLKQLFFRLARQIFPSGPSRPQDIPKKLDASSLEKAMQEARFLRSQHEVSVRPLATDEIPGLPRRAED